MLRSSGCNLEVKLGGRNTVLMLLYLSFKCSGWQPASLPINSQTEQPLLFISRLKAVKTLSNISLNIQAFLWLKYFTVRRDFPIPLKQCGLSEMPNTTRVLISLETLAMSATINLCLHFFPTVHSFPCGQTFTWSGNVFCNYPVQCSKCPSSFLKSYMQQFEQSLRKWLTDHIKVFRTGITVHTCFAKIKIDFIPRPMWSMCTWVSWLSVLVGMP